MKQFLPLMALLCLPLMALTDAKEYTASNGITYKPGDLIEFGQGSSNDGNFIHVRVSGWGAMTGAADKKIGASLGGEKGIIKRISIEKNKRRNYEKIWMLVDAGNITPYSIDLEQAIRTCEVIPCKK